MTGFNISTISDCYIGNTEALAIYLGSSLKWTKYYNEYFTLVPLESGTFTWTDDDNNRSIYYSTDNGSTWTRLTSGSTTSTIAANNKVLLKANLGAGTLNSSKGNGTISSSGRFNVRGNIMSLVYSDNFIKTNLTNITNNYQFARLFNSCTKLINADDLILPSTNLSGYNCYEYMFAGCTMLSNVPKLYATKLSGNCYHGMFLSCTSLTTAPQLPATTLAGGCYSYMFYNCTSLTTAPELLATTLVMNCYEGMFKGCTSLTTAPELPATTAHIGCYNSMFYGCTSLTTAPALPATSVSNVCYESMFEGCTSLTTAPELPATSLVNASACYESMFEGCTSLTTAPSILPATTLTNYCYYGMFKGCTSLTTAPELPATELRGSCYQSMFEGCTSLNYIKCLATTNINTSSSTTDWIYNVASSGTFVKALSATWPSTGYNGIPSGWTVQNYTPAHDYSQDYLTLETLEAGTFKWTDTGSSRSISYSTDDGSTWTTLTAGSTTPTIAANSKVLLKATLGAGKFSGNGTISSSGRFNVMGNIMSLVGGDNFNNLTTISNNYQFKSLFRNCTKLTDASNLILPATTLSTQCYYYLFMGCTSLTTAPELPATTLAGSCYAYMFNGCSSLTTAPTLPATTLADGCYDGMFSQCSSLTTAPELPATTLANRCYSSMFWGCSSLTTTPSLPATTLVDRCYYRMFWSCTSLTTVPALPATTLVNGCYKEMFKSCTSLNEVHCDATDISATDCLTDWLSGVSQTGDFYKPSTTTYPTGTSGIPSGWTVHSIVHDFSQDYLTFQILENGVIPWKQNTTAKTIEYSLNGGTWTSITSTSAGTMINVSQGDTIRFRGNNTTYCNANKSQYSGFGLGEGSGSYVTNAASFNVEGNIMSLIYGDNFANQTTFNGETYNFCSLFKKAKVVSAENLILPVISLTDYCYRAMFSKCTYLEIAPQLPATTLAIGVYYYMFDSAAITEAPDLPATTLADSCYSNMFNSCKSLTTAPDLPATTLVESCYSNMFRVCTSLNYIKCLATDISAYHCTNTWVINVAVSGGTFVKAASMSSWTTSPSGIPSGWIVTDNTSS